MGPLGTATSLWGLSRAFPARVQVPFSSLFGDNEKCAWSSENTDFSGIGLAEREISAGNLMSTPRGRLVTILGVQIAIWDEVGVMLRLRVLPRHLHGKNIILR